MIEKLKRLLRKERDSGFTISEPVSIGEMQEKINELVDAVNEIMTWRFETDEDSDWYDDPKYREQPTDPYAEQRKWRGKLCKFWDDSDKPENCVYDVLCNIFDLHHEDCPFQCGNGEWYEYCEPVKPTDSIIYKGE